MVIEIGCKHCKIIYDPVRGEETYQCEIKSKYFYCCEKCPYYEPAIRVVNASHNHIYRFRATIWFKTKNKETKKIPVKIIKEYVEEILKEKLRDLEIECEVNWVSGDWKETLLEEESGSND